MEIYFQVDPPFAAHVATEPIEKALQATATLLKKDVGSIGVTITDNPAIQHLNYQYRGVDMPTDVLSFENSPDPDFPDVDPSVSRHLGDIVIAYPTARAQAEASGHSPQDEVILLAVHGALHLLGFNHDTPQNKEKMWAAQQQIMAKLGLAHVQPTES